MRSRTALVSILLVCLAAPSAAVDLRDEVFYHFMPIAWRDSDGDAYRFGDFDGVTASLDYLEQLGITAVWVNPIFPSPAYHGYQHGPADQLNPWFGTQAQWVGFVQAAHARDIKVYVDFVAYGISHDSPWYQSAYGNPASPYDEWLAFFDGANTSSQGGTPYTTWNGSSVGFIHWDLRHPGPRQLVTDWARKWLDPNEDGSFDDGLDGYRLDHVWWRYPNGPDGWGYHITEFWAPWRSALRQLNPDVRVFAEQADWGSFGAELFGGMDAAFTKPFEFAARDALANETAAPLYGSMAATVASLVQAPADRTYLATIGNHDVSRLASVIGDSFAKGKVAAAVLLLQPFAPVLYYGDEIGMRGTKNTSLPGDAADIPMREPFEWKAAEGAPMTRYHRLSAPAFAAQVSANFDGRSVEEQLDVPGSQLEAYRELIALRRAHIGLRRGGYAPVPNDRPAVWSFVRTHADQQVLVVINLGAESHTAQLDFSGFTVVGGATTPHSLRTAVNLPVLTSANQGGYALTLPAYGYEIASLQIEAPEPPTARTDGRELHGQQLAVQVNPTDAGDDENELDVLVVRGEAEGLVIGIGGNLTTQGRGVCLFVDARSGGQNTLDVDGITPPPYGPHALGGLRFDLGFEPELLLYVNAYQGQLYLDEVRLLDGGGAEKVYRGSSTVGSGIGVLNGGSNPNAMEVALDNANRSGVTASSAVGAGEVTTGLEFFLPWADLNDAGIPALVGLSAVLIDGEGSTSNQWLPPLTAGSGAPGIAPDLRTVGATQHVFFDPAGGAVSAPTAPGSRLVFDAPVPNPFNPQVSFRFELPRAAEQVLVEIFDLAGRRVRTLLDAPRPAGTHQLSWDGADRVGRRVASGVYLVRLRAGDEKATRRVMLVQ